jgi:cell division septation protein DedD
MGIVKKLMAVALILGGMLIPAAASAVSQPRDCESNSIMWCGAYTKSEFLSKIANGDGHNTAADLRHIYYSEGRGITSTNFNSSATVDGVVFKDGHVEVAGKTVATGAVDVGRSFKTGSVRSGSVWERTPQISFAANSIQAWVNMDGGTFHYFILKSCGNAGRATPVKKPTPSPTPSHTPSPTPTHTPTPTPSHTPSPTPTHTPTPTSTPTPTKTPGEVLGVTLPDTGPEAALGGVAGLTTIGFASRAYLRSRRSLLSTLRGKSDKR